MAFYVTVTQGADEGRTLRVEPGECIIGRSPSSGIVLDDDSIAWEHAVLREDDSGRLLLQNLAAAGTRVKGRRVTDEVRLASNDEIELSEKCRVVVRQRAGKGVRGVSRRTGIVLAVVGLVIVVGAVAAWALKPAPPPPRRVTAAHWQQAFRRIEDRMEIWVDRGLFPPEVLTVYRDAWRLEQALNPAAAAAKWEQMRGLLLTLPFPGEEDKRLAEKASTNSKALRVIMGWDLESSSTDFRWNTDAAYADALVWFVRRRAEYSRRRAEQEQQ